MVKILPGNWPAFIAPGSVPPAPGYRLPVGFLLCNRFRIVRFIAQGGMGSVYEAEDLEMREHVALKMLRPEIVEDPRLLERFRREAQLARRVTHPNVCRIYDVFRHEVDPQRPASDVVFLVMELLAGVTLMARIREKGPFTAEEALPIARQLADALEAAHRAAVVHRDFKSANILLGTSREGEGGPRAVVTDFGIARSLEPDTDGRSPELTETGEAIGTRDYSSPEQLAGGEVTAATDVYALGVVLYEMVTGQRPYQGDEPVATRFERPPLPPGDLAPGLPQRWSSAILRCLARDPAKRFARAPDAVAALAGTTTRRRLPPAVAVGALVLAAAALVVVAVKVRPSTPERPRFPGAVQVTSSSLLDGWPAFTPDGESIVYASEKTGSLELYLLPLASGAREVPVTSDGKQSLQPAVSPDGRTIAFLCRERGGIWTVPLTGGTAMQLTTFGSRPAFSPDGKLVAFQSDTSVSGGPMELGAMPPSALWSVSSGGGNPRRLTRAGDPPGGHGSPAFSPDGRWIVFTAFVPESSRLWLVPVEGGNALPLASSEQFAFDPVVSADGDLYFGTVTVDWRYAIKRVSMDWRVGRMAGSPVDVSASGGLIPRNLALSRDGRRLAYAGLALRSNLVLQPVDPVSGAPAGPARPLTTEAARNSRPAFSPDGRRIAFTKWRPGVSMDVWLLDVASGVPEQVTVDPSEDTIPSWFPSGDRIAFQSSRLGHSALFGKSLPGGREQLLFDPGDDMDVPRLSPDGKRVAFNSKRGGGTINVWVADVPGGRPRQVTFDRELAGFPSWSPDGKTLAVQVRRGQDRQVGIVPAEGGEIELLTDASGQSWSDAFSPDGSRIVFAGLRRGLWNIYSVSRATREVRQLTAMTSPNGYVRYPSWSPKGDLVVYESAETMGNVWMLSR